jgi:hypothetical protein
MIKILMNVEVEGKKRKLETAMQAGHITCGACACGLWVLVEVGVAGLCLFDAGGRKRFVFAESAIIFP